MNTFKFFRSAIVAIAAVASLNAQAAQCTANVIDGTPVKYSNSGYVSNIYLRKDSVTRTGYIMIHNISAETVTVKVTLNYVNGVTGQPSATNSSQVYAVFSSSNDPRSASGASMAPGTMGQIDLSGTTTPHNVNATISWEAEKCVNSPLLASVEQYSSSGGGLGFYAVNGGNPF